MNARYLLLGAFLFLCPAALGAEKQPFDAIDKHALKATKNDEKTIVTLAAYLIKTAKTDRDKVRAIVRWMTDRIAYAAEDFLAGKLPEDCSSAAVLKARKTVCEGYANLFVDLCKEAKIDAVKVSGFMKGYGYKPGDKVTRNHSWNAVKIGDDWHLLDVTLAAGTVDVKNGFTKTFDEYYFLTPPDRLVFSHLPEQAKWQLLKEPVKDEVFQKWPLVPKQLLKWGADPAEVRKALAQEGFGGFCMAYNAGNTPVKLIKAPIQKRLKKGTAYPVRIEMPGCNAMAFINGKNWTYLTKKNGAYEGKLIAAGKKVKVGARIAGQGNSFWTLLEYEIESK